MKTHTKMIAASLSLMATTHVFAGVGGLNVQSNLGEPFSGSIVVTGREAEALIRSGSVSVSGNGIQGTVVPQGSDKALIRLRSSAAINDPVVNLTVKAGNQTRQYTVMVNPANYRPRAANNATTTRTNTASTQQTNKRAQAVPTPQGPFGNDYNPNRQTGKTQPESNTERVRKSSATQQQRTRSVRPRYYRVGNGESLASIAARYRPHGMSVQRAMRALVAANPRAFRNGNPNAMYRNVTLYIPTASQWHAYSNRRIQQTHAPRPAAQLNMNKPTIEKPVVQPTQPIVSPSQTETVVNTQQNQPKSAEVKQPNNKQQETVKEPKIEKPVEVATTPAFASDNKPKETEVSSTPATASVPAASTAPVTVASTPVPVVASAETVSVASDVAVVVASQASGAIASAEVASTPPKPKPKKRPPMPVEEPVEEEGFDWSGLALPVGGGLLALGLLSGGAYLLNRRRKANAATDDEEYDDEDVSFDDDNSNDEWAVTPAVKATTSTTDVDAEWDLPETTPSFETSDELFDLPVEESTSSVQAASNTSSNQDFDLNNFEPDNLADFSANTAPEEDFDWAVSEEPETPAAVAVETEESWEVDTDLLSTPTVSDAATDTIIAKSDDWLDDTFLSEPVAEATPATVETADEEEWLLDDSFSVSETAAPTETTPVAADEDWLSDSFTVEESVSTAQVNTTDTVDEFFNLDLPSEPTTPPAAQIADSLDALDITLPETEVDFTPSAPVETTTHDDILDFGLDLPTTAVVGTAATAVAATVADNIDTSFDVDMNLEAPSAPADSLDEFSLDLPIETNIQAATSEEISLDDFGLDLPTEATTPEVEIAAFTDTPEISVDDFGLDLPTVEEPTISLDAPVVETADFNLNDIPEVADSVISLDTPDIAVDDFGLELPTEPATEVSLDDFDLDMTVEEPQTSIPVADEIGLAFDDNLSVGLDEPAQIETTDNSLSFADDLSLNIDEPVQAASVADDLSLSIDEPAATPSLAVAESVDTASWDIADAPKEVGFVSESVDMTAPMEARLELAKMYLEIDDAVAARETLRELINESSGDVQHQAKQLLNELGG